jgi:hypothetical protein
MKKIFALALVLLLATAVSSFANSQAPVSTNEGKSLYGKVGSAPTATNDAAATLIGKCSKGVYAGWNVDANGYVLVMMHMSGNRAFGSSHDATAIYRNDTLPTAAPGVAEKSYFGASWTAM